MCLPDHSSLLASYSCLLSLFFLTSFFHIPTKERVELLLQQ